MIEDITPRPAPQYSRITPEASWWIRRVCAVLISAWLGGVMLVSLAAPAVFEAGEIVIRHPAPAHAPILRSLPEDLIRDLLRYHAGEANNQVFALWGTLQVVYGAAVLLLLLFFSDVGKLRLGLAGAMLLLALLMKFFLIPAVAETSRLFRSTGIPDAGRRFQMLHGAFAAFEIASAVLGLALLWLLLAGSRSSSRRRSLS
ncbi:MAG: hypothetical protein N2036_11675 [Bryobacteraceae bacterium]|nr:hypothetical protein [Bryobacteraceae bacterium]